MNTVEDLETKNVSILEQVARIQEEYYAKICNSDGKVKTICGIQDQYTTFFDKVATLLTNIDTIKDGSTIENEIDNAYFEMILGSSMSTDYQLQITKPLLDNIICNEEYLDTTGYLKRFERPVHCIICDKLIKGIGIMDFVDAGTNAVCFNSIDTKHHYIGSGMYFTKFT